MSEFEEQLKNDGFTVFPIAVPEPSPKAKEFRKLCEKNECGEYGTNWGCPPGVGTLEEITKALGLVSKAFLVRKRYELNPNDRGEVKQASDDMASHVRRAAGMMIAEASVKMIGDGGCHYCGVCTYPNGECKQPLMRIDSVSAYGIDIEEVLRQVDLEFVFEKDAITLNSILLVGELRP
ncbi:MAG TPA: DUF2284 domain-containing protein [Candidatus Methanomethylophilaceae archaeon]|nr:DUF2284 domain-containing protein [Candidatus Methanomethylophilaceae archaeon]